MVYILTDAFRTLISKVQSRPYIEGTVVRPFDLVVTSQRDVTRALNFFLLFNYMLIRNIRKITQAILFKQFTQIMHVNKDQFKLSN